MTERDSEEKKAGLTDELLILQAAVQAILILIKKLSDYSMSGSEDREHLGEGREGRDFLSAQLELRLQLLALPYSLPQSLPLSLPLSLLNTLPSEEHKDEKQTHCPQSIPPQTLPSSSSFSTLFIDVSNSAVKRALSAFTQFTSVSNRTVSTTPIPIPSSTSTSFSTSTCAFTGLNQLEKLRKYLTIVQIAQSTLALLLLILTKQPQHLPQQHDGPNRPSDGPNPSEKSFQRGRKDKSPIKKAMGSKPVRALNEGQVQERENVWYSLMILCSDLQCAACTSSFVFFADHIPHFPPISSTTTTTAAAAFGIECGVYEEDFTALYSDPVRHISPSPSGTISVLIAVASQRAEAVAYSSHSAGGSDSSSNISNSSNSNNNNKNNRNSDRNSKCDRKGERDSDTKSDCVDLRIAEELWAVVRFILGLRDTNPLSSLSADSISYFLGRVLCVWNQFKVPIEIFETRTLDLCVADSTSESGMSLRGDIMTAALRQLLLRWRKRHPLHCVCGQPERVDKGHTHPVTYFRKSSTDTDLCPCCQVYSMGSTVGEIDGKAAGPDWLQTVKKLKFSSRFLIKIMP